MKRDRKVYQEILDQISVVEHLQDAVKVLENSFDQHVHTRFEQLNFPHGHASLVLVVVRKSTFKQLLQLELDDAEKTLKRLESSVGN